MVAALFSPSEYMGQPEKLAALSDEQLSDFALRLWAAGRCAEYGVFLREQQRRLSK